MTSVAYVCPFVPAEWIEAHGHRPVRLVPTAAAGRGGLIEATEGLCPFARATVNEIARRGRDEGAVFTTTCDQMRRAAELLAIRLPNRPAFVLNVPATWRSEAAKRMYADELRRMGRFLVGLGGVAPTNRKLTEIMLAHDDTRGTAGLVGQEAPGKIPLERGGETPMPRPIPLAIVGGPMLAGQRDVFSIVERLGGHIVLDATEGGETSRPAPLDRDRVAADPFSALVDAYFAIPHAMRRPDSMLHEYLAREFAARGVRGILVHRQLWCDLWHGQLARIREFAALPVLDIDVADENADFGRQAGRIQAFMEMIR